MNRGGAELRTLDLVRQCKNEKYSFDFCILSGQKGVLDDELLALGCHIHYLKLDLYFRRKFLKLLSTKKYDSVHSHVHDASGYFLRLAYLAGVKQRIAHYRSTSDGRRNTFLRQLKRLIFHFLVRKYATNIVGVSRATLNIAFSNKWENDSRCEVIYNGLPVGVANCSKKQALATRLSAAVAADDIFVLHVGNMRPPKNHKKLFSVFKSFKELRKNSKLICIGDDSSNYAVSMKKHVRDLGLSNCVRFLGSRDDVARFYEAADIFIFPSHFEGLPGALLEAARAGLPVLASDIAVIQEIKSLLPWIEVESVESDDLIWSERMDCLLALKKNTSRSSNRLVFETSPFCLDRSAMLFQKLWSKSVNNI